MPAPPQASSDAHVSTGATPSASMTAMKHIAPHERPPSGIVQRRVVQFSPACFEMPIAAEITTGDGPEGTPSSRDPQRHDNTPAESEPTDRGDASEPHGSGTQGATTGPAPITPTLEEILQRRSISVLNAGNTTAENEPATSNEPHNPGSHTGPESSAAEATSLTSPSIDVAATSPGHNERITILLLCAGPKNRPKGLHALLSGYGFEVRSYDVADGISGDISDDSIWNPLAAEISAGRFCGVFASPPCSTFSRARSLPGGPPPLRGPNGGERYGLASNTPKDKERVREANLLAERCSFAIRTIGTYEKFAVIEQPRCFPGLAHMYHFDSFLETLKANCFTITNGVQCPFGATAPKATSWLSTGINLNSMPAKCTHHKRMWFAADGLGKTFARHPPSKGRMAWSSTPVTGPRKRKAEYNTSRLQAYPTLLNRVIASAIALSLRGGRKRAAHDVPCLRFSFSHATDVEQSRPAHETT